MIIYDGAVMMEQEWGIVAKYVITNGCLRFKTIATIYYSQMMEIRRKKGYN